MIQFGEWLPDQPETINKGVTVAKNCIPAANGYRSIKELASLSGAATAKLRGIVAGKDNNGNTTLFAGDSTKLYKFNAATSALDNVTQAATTHSLQDGERWRFVQFGETMIAAGGTGEALQKFQLGTDTAFADLAGSPPKADYIAVVRDQVWLASIDEGSGKIPFRTRWSGINDETSWTVGTDQADFQDIFGGDSGAITGLTGGEFATILMERGIAVAQYVGTPLIYQIDLVETSRGCSVPQSVVSMGANTYFLSDDGFYMFDGRQARPIGAEKINRWFWDHADTQYLNNMSAAIDPRRQIVAWAFTSVDTVGGLADYVLFYNYALNRWSYAIFSDIEILAALYTGGYSLEDLDNISATLDGLNIQLDDPALQGGEFFFGAGKDKKIQTFTGSIVSAVIETPEAVLNKGRHSIITRTIPFFENGDVNVQISTRNLQNTAQTFSAASNLTADGFTEHRAQGRFHKVRMNMTGNWKFAQGVDIEQKPLGTR